MRVDAETRKRRPTRSDRPATPQLQRRLTGQSGRCSARRQNNSVGRFGRPRKAGALGNCTSVLWSEFKREAAAGSFVGPGPRKRSPGVRRPPPMEVRIRRSPLSPTVAGPRRREHSASHQRWWRPSGTRAEVRWERRQGWPTTTGTPNGEDQDRGLDGRRRIRISPRPVPAMTVERFCTDGRGN